MSSADECDWEDIGGGPLFITLPSGLAAKWDEDNRRSVGFLVRVEDDPPPFRAPSPAQS